MSSEQNNDQHHQEASLRQGCRQRMQRVFHLKGGGESLEVDAPFSLHNELKYFVCKGMPMCFGSLMNFGIPPLVAMSLAGHTDIAGSAHLQASLGYARLWYNCTSQMPSNGLTAYFLSVIPGCIGAGRKDRIPRYFQRSILQTLLIMIPFFILQFFTSAILQIFGVSPSNADDVGVYSRLMIITAILGIINGHLEIVLNNLGYVKCTMVTSLISGLGIDSTCNYVFVLRCGWGMWGAAVARILVQGVRFIMFSSIVCLFGLVRVICIARHAKEPVLSRAEFKEYIRMGVPTLLTYIAGWLVFELQILMVTNIEGISQHALAAGAIWVQFEGALASGQQGWIASASIRSLALLGKKDPGARKAFWLFHNIAALLVAALNIIGMLLQDPLCGVVSNSASVQNWFGKIFWILTVHSQTRISSLITFVFHVPVGRGTLRTITTFVTFWCVAAPLAFFVSLTDVVTTSIPVKLGATVGFTSLAQLLQVFANFAFLYMLDWNAAAHVISMRANTDCNAIGADVNATSLISEDSSADSAHGASLQNVAVR